MCEPVSCTLMFLSAESANLRFVRLEDPDLGAVVLHPDAHAIGLAAAGIEDGHVGSVDTRLFLDDATLPTNVRIGLGVALHHVDAGNDQLTALEDAVDLSALAFVAAGNDYYLVVLFQLLHFVSLRSLGLPGPPRGTRHIQSPASRLQITPRSENFGRQGNDAHEFLG